MSIPTPSPPRRILLLQLPLPEADSRTLVQGVPFAVARLVATVRAAGPPGVEIDLLPPELLCRLGDAALIAEVLARDPDWVGFSCSVWNLVRSLELAARLKALRPELTILLGGPELRPDNVFLRERSASFDLGVRGEGERPLLALLEAALAGGGMERVPGLLVPGEAGFFETAPEPLLDPSLLVSPYGAGILDPVPPGMLLVESTRGCKSRCGFCSYAMGRPKLLAVPQEDLEADLRLARELEVPEVYLLDPSLGQRPGLTDFLRFLAEQNPAPQRELFGELRAEAVTPEVAGLMAAAGFAEVELGLQSIGKRAQRLMGRRNRLERFVEGAHELLGRGIRCKVDAIVGLPGDDAEGVRATLRFLIDNGLAGDPLVFPLAVLPGTRFRREAEQLGLVHQAHPPYHVLSTPTLPADELSALFVEAEELLDLDLLSPHRPVLTDPTAPQPGPGLPRLRIDLDHEEPADAPWDQTDLHLTLWLRAQRPLRVRERATVAVRAACRANPHGLLHVVLEAPGAFPYDVFDDLLAAWAPHEHHYLEAAFVPMPVLAPASRRLFVLLPASAATRCPRDWREDLPPAVQLVWRLPEGGLARSLEGLAGLDPVEEEWALLAVPDAVSDRGLCLLRDGLAATSWPLDRILWDDLELERRWDGLIR